jgi:pimeloyl-ACP methyl ester carboxylesterase
MLAILGVRDPLLPPAARIKQVVRQMHLEQLTIAVIKEAAHAINLSHPRETADLIRGFLRGEPLRSTLEPVDGRSPVAVISRAQ